MVNAVKRDGTKVPVTLVEAKCGAIVAAPEHEAHHVDNAGKCRHGYNYALNAKP